MSATTPSSKPKSGVSDSSNNKTTSATPKVSKLGRPGSTKSDSLSPSPQQKSRLSIDRSPKSVDLKPAVERRSLKISTPPDKLPRSLKESELQAKLVVVQEDQKKATEQLASIEQEKFRVLEELKDAKRLTDEANEKLKQSLVAQKRAKESLEIEKFRADELEQAGIEAAQKRDGEWHKELENVRNQHAVDLATLFSTTQELQRIKHELTMTTEAKNTALSHADDAMKIAEINAEKMVFLSGEVSRLKTLLDSRMENMSNETAGLVRKLDSEVDTLKHELEKAKVAEEKLVKMEELVEGLKTEVADAKRAETDAGKLLDEWKRKTELLVAQMEEANLSEKTNAELVKKLYSEIDVLRHELERAKVTEEKLVETEALIERLRTEVSDAKMAEEDSGKLIDEWKRKAESLEVQVEEANQSKNETIKLVKKLDSEVDALKLELEKAKAAEKELVEVEALVEGLRTEVNDVKKAETYAGKQVDEWKRKTELLEVQLEEANQSEKSALDSLAVVSKQLEVNNALVQGAESEISALKGIMESLEIEVARHKVDLHESERHHNEAHQETLELGKTVEVLKSELLMLQEEKSQMLDNEKAAASNIESLSEERNKLINELEIARDEGEKVKKAMEGLVSALHEVSTEARETQERLLAKQAESKDAYAQIEELKYSFKNTEERYQIMLDEARYEIVCLKNSVERYETTNNTSRIEWDEKEVNFVNTIKKSEEELASLKVEMGKVVDSLKGVEHEAQAAREAETKMLTELRRAECGANVANEAAEALKAEALLLKERLLDKENTLQSITHENDGLRIREATALEKVRELSALLTETTAKRTKENGALTNSDNDYDILPNTKELQEEITDESEDEKSIPESTLGKLENCHREDTKSEENVNGKRSKEGEPTKVDVQKWESWKVMERDSASEREHEAESTDDELDSKIDSSNFDQINGLPPENIDNGAVSPRKSQQPKKKAALLHKFGNLLKKKNYHK